MHLLLRIFSPADPAVKIIFRHDCGTLYVFQRWFPALPNFSRMHFWVCYSCQIPAFSIMISNEIIDDEMTVRVS